MLYVLHVVTVADGSLWVTVDVRFLDGFSHVPQTRTHAWFCELQDEPKITSVTHCGHFRVRVCGNAAFDHSP